MNICFKKLQLHNFFSFADETLDFTDKYGYIIVSGHNNNISDCASSNGSGKSTIWEAINWALTGETIRGTKDVKRFNSDSCFVSLEFTLDNNSYNIIRYKDPSNLKLFYNGSDISGKGIRDTEKILETYIPEITSSFIGSVIILGQGLPQKFTNNTPAGRKEVLEKLSKSDFMITELKERVTKRKEKLLQDQVNLEKQIVENESTSSSKQEYLNKLQDELDNIQDIEVINNRVSELTLAINTQTTLKDKLQSTLTQRKEEEKELLDLIFNKQNILNTQLEQELSTYTKSIDDCTNDLLDIKVEINSATTELNKINNIVDVCPTCGQKLINVKKPDPSALEKKLAELQLKKETLETTKRNILKEKLDKEDTIRKRYANEIDDLISKKDIISTNIHSIEGELSSITSKISTNTLEKDRLLLTIDNQEKHKKNLVDTIEQLNSEIKNCIYIVENLNYYLDLLKLHIDAVNKFITILSRDFRGFLLQNVIKYIDKKVQYYSNFLFKDKRISFILDGNNIDIYYDTIQYENLSGGERVRCDIVIQLALRDMLCQYLNFSSNILVIDEIFDSLDFVGCENILNLIFNNLKDVKTIYIITHRKDLPISCDDEIIVEKDSLGVSTIRHAIQ